MKRDEATVHLFNAIMAKDFHRARAAIDAGANVNSRVGGKVTLLHLAAFDGPPETVRLLIENGGDIHAKDDGQLTPLHLAAGSGNTDTVKLLIKNGADLHAREKRLRTPLDIAVAADHSDVVALLKAAMGQRPRHAALVTERRDADEKRER